MWWQRREGGVTVWSRGCGEGQGSAWRGGLGGPHALLPPLGDLCM